MLGGGVPSGLLNVCSMFARLCKRDINEQGKYRTHFLANISHNKTPCSGGHATAYTVPRAVITFKVIQGE